VTGTEDYDHITLKRVDASTSEAELSHAGRVFGTARRVISPDGRSMTITFTREIDLNRRVNNVAFYEKAPLDEQP
jgi:hypothetical protein